jgi:hypothetical protein
MTHETRTETCQAMREWLRPLLLLFCVSAVLEGQRTPRTASGVVLGTDGRPIDGACVLAVKREDWLTEQAFTSPTARTTKDGAFLCPLKDEELLVIAAGGKSSLLVHVCQATPTLRAKATPRSTRVSRST